MVKSPRSLLTSERVMPVPVGVVDREALANVFPAGRELTAPQSRGPSGMMRLQGKLGITDSTCDREHLVDVLLLPPDPFIRSFNGLARQPQSPGRGESCAVVAIRRRQFGRPAIRAFRIGVSEPPARK